MAKEVYITKMPQGTMLQEFVAAIVGDGYDTRSKEEVDEKLIEMGIDDIRGTYIRITVEEIE